MEELLKTIRDTEAASFQDLFSRMDTDRELYNLKDFKLKDRFSREMPNVKNITWNDPLVFAQKVIAVLLGATMQADVKSSDMGDKGTSLIESFQEDYYNAADEEIAKRGLESLYVFSVEQIVVRGWVGARCVNYWDGDKFVPDILPCDTRYLVYEAGRNGPVWVAHKMVRSNSLIEQEYGINISSTYAVVWDYWDSDRNVVFVGDRMVKEDEHLWGEPPFVIEAAWGGSLLQDYSSTSRKGESVFAANRHLYPKYNEAASMLLTQSSYGFKPPMQFKSPHPENPPESPEYGSGAVIPVGNDEGFELMPNRDMLNSTRYILSMIESRLQRGSLSAVEYGNLTFPLSAVAISRLTSQKDQLVAPRIQALAAFYQKLTRMVVSQLTTIKFKGEIGGDAQRTTYSYTSLQGDYALGYKFHVITPEQNIANYTVAAAAHDAGISSDTIKRGILQLENPEEETQKRQAEDAVRSSPVLTLYNRARSLIEQNRNIEARLLAAELKVNLDRLMGGELPQEPQGNGDKPRMPIPLMPGGQGGYGAKTPQRESFEMDTQQEAD